MICSFQGLQRAPDLGGESTINGDPLSFLPPPKTTSCEGHAVFLALEMGNSGYHQPRFHIRYNIESFLDPIVKHTSIIGIDRRNHEPGHGMGSLVVLPGPGVAAVRLDQLLQTRDAQLDAVVAAQAPDGRKLAALWQAHLVADEGVRLGDRQLRLANILLQHLALFPAQLAWTLGPFVAEGKGGVADGGDGELSTACGHVG